MRSMIVATLLLGLLLAAPLSGHAANAQFSDIVDASEHKPGFLPLYWHAKHGKLYAEVTDLNSPFIYYNALSQGVGSNDLGLDRGRLGDTQLVQFERVGPRVLMVALNTRYRASSDNALERRAVEEAFAQSVLWGFDIVAEDDDRLLIDLTEFSQHDALSLASLLASRGEGQYKVDTSRSVVNMARTKAFPDNSEVDAMITLTGDPKGDILDTVSPDPRAVTVHIHHSFVRLPDDGYTPLPYDPRAGFIDGDDGNLFLDYASPIDEPIKRGYAWRHRLEKVDPNAERSPAVEPIIYYVDPGVPEPIRSALVEGASWWNQAFEAAGYIDGFQVKLLPEDADPMDVRYNVIQWVHRSTRGWSYGMSVRDPRTQEIIKGHVSLGSLRVRQDYLLAEGLLAPYGDDEVDAAKAKLREFALARIRQLSAHEVGHTIGLEHNFAASADGRASVMDYPHPWVELSDDGELVIDDAYDVGIGEWDKRAITWGYADFPEGTDESAAREAIIERTLASGLSFVADQHARNGRRSAAGPSHPRASLWDNGEDPVAELDRLMALRAAVLGRFSEQVIQPGQPLARIEDVLVPAYLMHRYQVQAAATLLGGRDFTYALRGDGQTPTQVIPADRQRAALDSLLATLEPAALTMDPALVALIPPRPPLSGDSRELFPRETGYLFDPLAAAGSAAKLTLDMVLDAKRAARLNNQRALDAALPDFAAVLDALLEATWMTKPAKSAATALVQQRVQSAVVDSLIDLVGHSDASTTVRAQAYGALGELAQHLGQRLGRAPKGDSWAAHYRFALARIGALEQRPELFEVKAMTVPPGSPI